MAVTLKRQKDGLTWRPYWYGVYEADGKRCVVNLGLKWQGTPPASGSLRDPGDPAFKRSREMAEAALERHRDEARRKGNATHLVERLIEAKTGRTVEHVTLAQLEDRWLNEGREYELSKGYRGMCKAFLSRFVAFMSERNPNVRFLYQVTPADAAAFASSVRAVMSPKTYREHLGLLRPAFDRLLPEGASNPFRVAFPRRARGAQNGDRESVHRRPFSPVELRAILDVARDNTFMYPLIVTAACTGMRRGDVCGLGWEAVDLAGGMLDVKTRKTGTGVEIPIFEPLRAVLEARSGNGSELVFPDAARMLAENPTGLSYRFKRVVAQALGGVEPTEMVPEVTPITTIDVEALAAIEAHTAEGPRRARILDGFKRYCAGQSYRDIEKATGIPRGVLSADLHAVEGWISKRFIKSARGPNMKAAIARVTREPRVQGQKSASVRDWHALRSTWVTLALTAGVPMELVRRVTGHATVDVVLRHYFRPRREDFKAALVGALPEVLTGRKTHQESISPADELVALATKVQSGTATADDKSRFRVLVAAV